MKPIIEIKNISKKFRIHHESSPYLSLRDSLTGLFRKNEKSVEDFFALNDVSFNVQPGETVGIIGKNGAGKSTLLKLLSKITPPTTGTIICRGRLASLLEVGTGFHPELTGRENIFFNGSILGMKKKEILRNFDAIVDFSGVEKFLDTPLKHYSSGMQLRLAFAVAAFLENEIMVIDEVLAVGDAEFQKKCIGKMEDVSKSGRTLLFVSHNLSVVQNLCKTSVYLKEGRVNGIGPTKEILSSYYKSFQQEKRELIYDLDNAPGNDFFRLLQITVDKVKKNNKDPDDFFRISDDIHLRFQFISNLPTETITDITYHLFDENGILVYVGTTFYSSQIITEGKNELVNIIPGNILNEGTYNIGLFLFVRDKGNPLYYQKNLVTFEIIPDKSDFIGWQAHKEGVLRLKTEWNCVPHD
jgi:lipopolysaccharide transport system ATP-binding protein